MCERLGIASVHSALFKSTPWRLTLSLGLIAILVLTLGGLIALVLVGAELDRRTEQGLQDRLAIIAKAYADGDETDLNETVTSFEQVDADGQHPVAMLAADGTVVAGDNRLASALTASSQGMTSIALDGVNYRILEGKIGAFTIVIGDGDRASNALIGLVRDGLLRAGVLLVAVLLIVGVGAALVAQRRLDRIASTLERVGAGDLAARFTLSNRDDDIDRLCAQVNAMLDRLQLSMQRVRDVTTDIAHDLKTPLTRLVLGLEDVTVRLPPRSDEAEALHAALAEAFRLNRAFEALLRLSQVEAGLGRERKRPVNIGALLRRVVDAYDEAFIDGGRRLIVTLPEAVQPVLGDEDLLAQAISNLLENAIRHTPQGTTVSISAESRESKLTITLADNGPGIPAADASRVFERHYRADTARSGDGLGIGLSLVAAIVAFHDGTVVVEENHPGARFVIRLEM